jgi:UDP-4-amino-4,6-dideoxy-N-acetyl-beta-L-altrosamine transaminase
MIPYGRQDISEADIQAVVDVLRSDRLTQGPTVPAFEKAVADHCGAPHALAVCNATAALHLACRAVGLGPGDLLWTSPNTFVASANCGRFCGADVDFVDIDTRTYNISADELKRKLQVAERQGRLPKVIIPVHFAGEPCDMRAIRELSHHYGFYVIEDASHAVGARYRDSVVGSCTYSDITVFSFHPVKIITTGEGGMTLTRDRELHEKMLILRSHGITRDLGNMTDPSAGAWYYEQLDLGYNYRMTDIQAALGASQMRRLDTFIMRRHELARSYDVELANLPVVLPTRANNNRSALHLYVVRLRAEAKRSRGEVFDTLRTAGIGVNVHYIPVHLQPYYRSLGFKRGDFPRAERYYEDAISLPLFYGLTDEAQSRVISSVWSALS